MRKHLLVIDDETSTESLYRRLFRQEIASGALELSYAEDGPQGMHLMQQCNRRLPDLVILDLNLPGPNGLEISRDILVLKKDMPIFIVTAYGDAGHRQKAGAIGVKEFLDKPTDIYALKAIISHHLFNAHTARRCSDAGEAQGQRQSNGDAPLSN